MAKKQVKRNNKSKAKQAPVESLAGEVTGVIFMVIGVLLGLSLYTSGGSAFIAAVNKFVFGLFGMPGYALPVFIVILGVLIIAAKKIRLRPSKLLSLLVGILGIIFLFHLFPGERYDTTAGFSAYIHRAYYVGSEMHIGTGGIGAVLCFPVHALLGKIGGIILSFGMILISVMLLTRLSLKKVGMQAANVTKKAAVGAKEAIHKASVSYEEGREKREKLRIERENEREQIRMEKEQRDRELLAKRHAKNSDHGLFVEDVSENAGSESNEPMPWGVDKKEREELLKEDFASVHSPYGALYPGLSEKKNEKRNAFVEVEEPHAYTAEPIIKNEPEKQPIKPIKRSAAVPMDEDLGYITAPTIRLAASDEPEDEEEDVTENRISFDIPKTEEIKEVEVVYPDEPLFEEEAYTEEIEEEAEDDEPPFDMDDDIEEDEDDEETSVMPAEGEIPDSYIAPPIEFLQESKTKDTRLRDNEEMRIKTGILEATLKSFSINAKVTNTVRGPVVTRYELQPAPGVKVRKIVELTNDIALNLAAQDIRIEAPIPGKAAIGIEVPNQDKTMVCARELLDTEDFRRRKSPITFALGKDIVGKNVYADIARMPHLLIAGETGSGKSVCINTIIVSLIYGASPKDVQLILVDPKKVELKPYENIPHLRIPIVTDPKKAAGALNWAVAEMMNRYKIFAMKGAKDLPRYNAILAKEGKEKLPYLVIIIDELADLMMTSSKEVEDAICRIAQLGRASGIHLIIATQTPRVNVITGNIKINVPTRIAFAVTSQVDSRVILDMGGAEKLLGKGDMLYTPPGSSKPIRVQGCYIDDSEIESITEFLSNKNATHFDEELALAVDKGTTGGNNRTEEENPDDELMVDAIRLALEMEQISSSMLQRRLKIGFNRAARIVDAMEERGFVGPSEGAKPRQVLLTWEEFHELYGDN